MLEMKDIIKETEEIVEMMGNHFHSFIKESKGTSVFFRNIRKYLKKIYLRPNNVIDTSLYSQSKIEKALNDMGFQFRQELEEKLHFFNDQTNTSVYLNPVNRKLTMTP